MSNVISVLRQAGMSELACQFAMYIERVDKTGEQLIPLTAALLSEAVSQGHVCLNLNTISAFDDALTPLLPGQLNDWVERLKNSNVVGEAGEYRPMIVDDKGLLYLYRHWQDEQNVAANIKKRSQLISLIDEEQLRQDFAEWQTTIDGIDWQKVAVLMALTRQFCVISGGPGTGKTTVVLRLLQSLQKQQAGCRIALAAPTGKAAARLQQATSQSGECLIQAKTLHRLLGITADNDQGRFNQDRTLPFDIIIVDEASMIDISLMAKLLQAMSAKTRLVLLGDSEQLASVESGAVLANLCQHDTLLSDDFVHAARSIIGSDLSQFESQGKDAFMIDSMVKLQHSYRFEQTSLVGRLAAAVQAAESELFVNELLASGSSAWQQTLNVKTLIEGYQDYIDAINRHVGAEECLKRFEQFRVLCALKQGPQSVTSVNALIERYLAKLAWRTQQDFYHGRPIMIIQNDYRQQLFNGDIGLILKDENGHLRACFLFDDLLRFIPLSRLPAHETAYAMTIHKSQGSEFEKVCVLLPEEDSALLTRELLYTAITRAKSQISLITAEHIIRTTVATQHYRETGLAEQLSNG
jgi:exodeoxyribonuclease V alpha subunit